MKNARYTYHRDGAKPFGDDDIFVFGSNLAGVHGAGAARAAFERYGAVWGKGTGISGRSYALPTKDEKIQTLPLETVRAFVAEFKAFAAANPTMRFFMTRVGCGLAGFEDADIAPMFVGSPQNINFPEAWKPWIDTLAFASGLVQEYGPQLDMGSLRDWAKDAVFALNRFVEADPYTQLPFTASEIAEMNRNPYVLAQLMGYHEVCQMGADSVFEPGERPTGNATRKQELYERGRSIVGQDPDCFDDELCKEFGFPPFEERRKG